MLSVYSEKYSDCPVALIEWLSSQSKLHVNLLRLRVLAQLLDRGNKGWITKQELLQASHSLIQMSVDVMKDYLKLASPIFFTLVNDRVYIKSYSRILVENGVVISSTRCVRVFGDWIWSIKRFRAHLHVTIARILNGMKSKTVSRKITNRKELYLRSRSTIGKITGTRACETAQEYERVTRVRGKQALIVVHDKSTSKHDALEWIRWNDRDKCWIKKVNNKWVIVECLGLYYEPLSYDERVNSASQLRIFRRYREKKNDLLIDPPESPLSSTRTSSKAYANDKSVAHTPHYKSINQLSSNTQVHTTAQQTPCETVTDEDMMSILASFTKNNASANNSSNLFGERIAIRF